MPMYRVTIEQRCVREYVVEAEDEDAAQAEALDGLHTPEREYENGGSDVQVFELDAAGQPLTSKPSLTFREVCALWRETFPKAIPPRDLPARREAWVVFLDDLHRNGRITNHQVQTWDQPPENQ